MAKPSIFSNSYRKQMRRRKITSIILLAVAIFGIAFLTVDIIGKGSLFSNLKNSLALITSSKEEEKIKEETPSENETPSEKEAPQEKKEDANKDIKKEINLNSNEKVSVVLSPDDNKIKDIEIDTNLYLKDINPSKVGAIVFNKNSQTLYYIDKDLNVRDITYKQYITTKGVKKTKENVLPSTPNFVWVGQPKFVSDNLIAYVSQVPWFETKLYLWGYNLADNTYKTLLFNGKPISGDVIEFQSINEKGLAVSTGGNNYIITPDNTVIK